MMNDQNATQPAPNSRTKKRRKQPKPLTLKPVALLAAVGVLAAGGVLVFDTLRNPQAAALAQDPGLEVLVVPEFAMTTQSGEAFTRADLLGNITVMDFFFTNCPAICPALSRSMKMIQDAVGDRGVRLISVSVDPTNDTEAALRTHAQELGADPAVWTFLRADDFEQVRVLSEDGLKLGLSLDDSRQIKTRMGDDMPWIDHSGKLLLLDSEARVIGLYSGLDERDVAALIKRLAHATPTE
jgi:cytochrome oxidase Cu insertion factor (SCO1/SenC/PrrC family)